MRRRGALVGLALLSTSCFGAGPDPGPTSTDRSVVIGTSPSPKSLFFGRVLLDDPYVYVALEGSEPKNGSYIWGLAKDGSRKVVLAEGINGGIHLAHDATDVYWVDGVSCDVHRVPRDGSAKPVLVGTITGGPTNCGAAGLVVDDTSIYVLVTTANEAVTAAFDPCCDLNGSAGKADLNGNTIVRVDKATGASSTFATGEFGCALTRCLWSDATSVYALKGFGGTVSQVAQIDKGTGTSKDIVSVEGTPVALAVTTAAGGGIAVASNRGNGVSGCSIQRVPPGGTAVTLYDTRDPRTCRDLVADDTSLYFVLTRPAENGGGLVGEGIGKIPIAGPVTTESLLPIHRDDFVTRRMLVGTVNMFLVESTHVVAVPMTLLP